MRKQAKNLGVSKDTIRNAVQDLGLVSYVRRRRQLLSDASKETRAIKGKKLLTWMKHNGSTSPDCNPLDYGIWGVVERKACSIPHASVDALKAAVEKEWAEMSVDFIVKTCKAFRPRIEAMLKANGGHFEL
ncbi:Uncharacterized protein FKW44_015644 [Caligus rogercresseyi]|uniref:Uncharacterized protein n=1 Tax=Caligus rogercresseyi TaxID=217165 RepID=A0A7T8K0L0_CALRO|nr:Uncharacterized protein FKW44_015644 [Caligus rogercresseyi]